MQRKVQCATNGKLTKVFPVYPRACLQVLQLGEALFQRTQLRPELRLAPWGALLCLFSGLYVVGDTFLKSDQYLFHETQIVRQPLPAPVKHVLGLQAQNWKLRAKQHKCQTNLSIHCPKISLASLQRSA